MKKNNKSLAVLNISASSILMIISALLVINSIMFFKKR